VAFQGVKKSDTFSASHQRTHRPLLCSIPLRAAIYSRVASGRSSLDRKHHRPDHHERLAMDAVKLGVINRYPRAVEAALRSRQSRRLAPCERQQLGGELPFSDFAWPAASAQDEAVILEKRLAA